MIVYFYILAILPCMVGGFLWVRSKEICWQEWLINSVLCFLMAGIFHLIAINGQTDDIEIWSGQVVKAKQYSAWREQYTEQHSQDVPTGTDANGNTTYTTIYWTTTEYQNHPEYWMAYSNINSEYEISKNKYIELVNKLGGDKSVPGKRKTYKDDSKMVGGDPNDYEAINLTGWIEPITKRMSFENRIKATPSTFSFAKVPENIKIFDYPDCPNPFISNRLIGTASKSINQLKFDQMNARLGPTKKVNVIIVGAGEKDSMFAEWQAAGWIGGKKNDVVILYGGNNENPTWVKTFGWTDSKIVLRNLEAIVLDNGAIDSTLDLIEKEIKTNYKLKNFEKDFAYIAISARPIHFIIYILVMILSQIGLWIYFHKNQFDKDGDKTSYKRNKYYWR